MLTLIPQAPCFPQLSLLLSSPQHTGRPYAGNHHTRTARIPVPDSKGPPVLQPRPSLSDIFPQLLKGSPPPSSPPLHSNFNLAAGARVHILTLIPESPGVPQFSLLLSCPSTHAGPTHASPTLALRSIWSSPPSALPRL